MRNILFGASILCLSALPGVSQPSVPIYRVTVIERSIQAVNYQYRSEPTTIDFRGTVLLPRAKGEGTVESKRGRTQIGVKLENLETPQRFGREYLTYVLWAISPEGRPHNIGEVVPNGSNKAKLEITTDLQAFGLIVTAEPYSAVRRPSDVVVAENVVRPDTIGKIEEIAAKYELMPRGEYLWQGPPNDAAIVNGPKVSMDEYEAISETYQAQNAIGIAGVANAAEYAPNTFAKAQQLLNEARRLQQFKGNSRQVVQIAREAAQTAEDARAIAERRRQDETVAKAQEETLEAREARVQADAAVQVAKIDADAARAQADAERAARERAEADAAAARQQAALAQADADRARAYASASVQVSRQRDLATTQRTELRMKVLDQLMGVQDTRDTPRGLVVTIQDSGFNTQGLQDATYSKLARVGAIVAAQPGLRVEVEGHTDSAASKAVASRRAEAVRNALVGSGLAASAVTFRGFGNTRPLASNASGEGRAENRRVEIVITGDPIGTMPFWDRAYTLSAR